MSYSNSKLLNDLRSQLYRHEGGTIPATLINDFEREARLEGRRQMTRENGFTHGQRFSLPEIAEVIRDAAKRRYHGSDNRREGMFAAINTLHDELELPRASSRIRGHDDRWNTTSLALDLRDVPRVGDLRDRAYAEIERQFVGQDYTILSLEQDGSAYQGYSGNKYWSARFTAKVRHSRYDSSGRATNLVDQAT